MQGTHVKIGSDNEFAYLIRGFLTPERIQSMHIDEWEPALVNMGNGRQDYLPEVRLCERALVKNQTLADELWSELESCIPKDTSYGVPVGLNPMFRFLKYGPGNYFKSHFDGTYKAEDGTISRITLQMYLNDDFTGGETVFYAGLNAYGDCVKSYTHVPQTGDAFLFDQRVLHEGAVVKSGIKLCVRTEVMFRV